MKILLTGATGFIGNHLIRELLKNKTNQLVTTSRSLVKAEKTDWFSKVEYIEYNLTDKSCDLNLYEFFGKPNQVIHLAWDGLSNYNCESHVKETLIYHCNFIENLVKGGLKDIVIAGTCFEYGMIEGCLSEDMEAKPDNPYGLAKDSLRKFIVEIQKKYNFSYKWIRFFYMFGEGQSESSLMYLLDKAINEKANEFNMSGGEQFRDFLHIDEVVKNIELIAFQDTFLNQPINCSSGEPISIKNLVTNYLKTKKYNIKLNLGFYPYPDYEPMNFWGDNSKLNKLRKEKNR